MKNHFLLSVSKLASATKPHVEFSLNSVSLSTRREFNKNLLGDSHNLLDGIIDFSSVIFIFRDHLIHNVFK
jgi:hypothetical protein